MRIVLFLCMFIFVCTSYANAQTAKPTTKKPVRALTRAKQDSIKKANAVVKVKGMLAFNDSSSRSVKLPPFPAISLNHALKGQVAGLYSTEPSGEPGTYQFMYIRGALFPILSAEDRVKAQPLILVDGLPIISNEHPFAYDIQLYDYSRIGPSTNLLAGLDIDNIESVSVLKDISEYAMYGPKASNGVISIKTKRSSSKKSVTFSTYFGLAAKPSVETFNGATENKFRKQFYNRYATVDQIQNYPAFLKDSLNSVYYGPSNWTDSYYKNALVYSANASVSGGTNVASFKFNVGTTSNSNVADNTKLEKYNVGFLLDMTPAPWMNFVTSINASRANRTRNKYNRDRIAEGRYLPDLSQPLSPNNSIYQNFLQDYSVGVDDNVTNIIDGYMALNLKLGKINFRTSYGVSYDDGERDLYNPTTLLETVSFGANYFGSSQRSILDNVASYTYKINDNNAINFQLGQSIQWDSYKYNYAYAYKNGNDYIKVNLLDANLQPSIFTRRLIFRFLDKTVNNQISFYGKADYSYKNWFTASALLRSDASSNIQPTNRWFYSPVLSASWNLKNYFLSNNKFVSDLKLKASYGRLGRTEINDRYAQGPQYVVDFGWTGEPFIPSYAGTTGLVRPYAKGYVGYNIPWAYNEQFGAGLDFGFWKNRIMGSVDLYSTTAHNQLIGVPSYAEYGYTKSYESGMSVNNSGVDVTLMGNVLPAGKNFQYTISINANYNKNKLKSLPRGLTQLVIGNRLLQVGSSTDQYWLLQNKGIYYTDSEIPVNPANNKTLTYQGLAISAGDPKWADLNGDYNIDNNDKTLMGHIMPVVSGGFNHAFRFKNWNLSADFYYNLGRNIINQDVANRFDFINRETVNKINSIKEITFWEKHGDLTKYPIYNVWSGVIPYRTDQDLFLENASFLKLRTLSLGYDLTSLMNRRFKNSGITKFYIYATADNVFTVTPYTGRDPELVDYTGYDTGYGLPIPRTYTVGIKMSL
jgi:TonB-linked SusC/RagA family outer membrane protein